MLSIHINVLSRMVFKKGGRYDKHNRDIHPDNVWVIKRGGFKYHIGREGAEMVREIVENWETRWIAAGLFALVIIGITLSGRQVSF